MKGKTVLLHTCRAISPSGCACEAAGLYVSRHYVAKRAKQEIAGEIVVIREGQKPVAIILLTDAGLADAMLAAGRVHAPKDIYGLPHKLLRSIGSRNSDAGDGENEEVPYYEPADPVDQLAALEIFMDRENASAAAIDSYVGTKMPRLRDEVEASWDDGTTLDEKKEHWNSKSRWWNVHNIECGGLPRCRCRKRIDFFKGIRGLLAERYALTPRRFELTDTGVSLHARDINITPEKRKAIKEAVLKMLRGEVDSRDAVFESVQANFERDETELKKLIVPERADPFEGLPVIRGDWGSARARIRNPEAASMPKKKPEAAKPKIDFSSVRAGERVNHDWNGAGVVAEVTADAVTVEHDDGTRRRYFTTNEHLKFEETQPAREVA